MDQAHGRTTALTVRYTGRTDRIISDLRILPAFDPAQPQSGTHPHFDTKALWDTGATKSVISEAAARTLGLVATGITEVNHAGGKSFAQTHLVNLVLPNGVGFSGLLVTESKGLTGAVGALIGMDIITQGDFAVTNSLGATSMSYRVPPGTRIDFVADIEAMKRAGKATPGRNDPCPCGRKRADGRPKKFKQCCGKGQGVTS